MQEHLESIQDVETYAEAEQRLARFLEGWPLYRRLVLRFVGEDGATAPTFPGRIFQRCSSCQRETPWMLKVSTSHRYSGPGRLMRYACTGCEKTVAHFWVSRATHKTIPQLRESAEALGKKVPKAYRFEKLGQHPRPNIRISRRLEATLEPTNSELYKKALVSIQHSFGLGALAYMRRVVEEATEELLRILEAEASERQDRELVTRLQAARASRSAEERLSLAANVLPDWLRPSGHNPLSALYDLQSRGIHGLSDEECLEQAMRLQSLFESFFEHLQGTVQDARRLRKAIGDAAGQGGKLVPE